MEAKKLLILLPYLVIKPVLFLQRAQVLQAQGVFVIRDHEACNRSRGQPCPVPSHLLFDVKSTKTKTSQGEMQEKF